MSALSGIKKAVPESLRRRVRAVQVGLSMNHLHGAKSVDVGPTEAAVTCVVKDGEFYVDQFIEHYLRLGFKHVCFLDNGSTDGTVDRAIRHKRVSVYQCTMPVGDHQGLLKQQIAERVVRSGWCLDVDIDEFFDYPYSAEVPLPRLLAYLNGKGFTAMVTQMLDMFSEQALSSLHQSAPADLKTVHRFFDISQVTKSRYTDDTLAMANGGRNQPATDDTQLFWGGIRKTIYNIDFCLTKHSLFRTGAGLELFPHVHFVNGARLADVSGILLHYKFAANAISEAIKSQAAFTAISDSYDKIVNTINEHPDLVIKTQASQEFVDVTRLLERGFVFASDDFKAVAGVAKTG